MLSLKQHCYFFLTYSYIASLWCVPRKEPDDSTLLKALRWEGGRVLNSDRSGISVGSGEGRGAMPNQSAAFPVQESPDSAKIFFASVYPYLVSSERI
jgi:hypothetical protein